MAKVLIIDDDDDALKILHLNLVAAGHETIELSSGKHLVETLKDEKPDIVITDIYMPDVDGVEVLIKVRESHSDLPVIVISGGDVSGDKTLPFHMTDFGANAILEKPINMPKLLSLVEELTHPQPD